MKHTIKLPFITLFILSSITGLAQVPGYLGKRLSVGYSMDVTPIGMNMFLRYQPILKYNGEYSNFWDLYLRHNLELEYVVGRQVALSGSIGFSRNGLFDYDHEPKFVETEYPKLSQFYDGYSQTHDNKDYDYVNATNTFAKIGALFFNKNYLAPYGKATGVYLLMNKSHIQYVNGGVTKDLSNITNYGVMITKSYRRIFYDAFILDWGVGFGLLFSPLGHSKNLAEYNANLQNQLLIFHGNVGVKYLIPQWKTMSAKIH